VSQRRPAHGAHSRQQPRRSSPVLPIICTILALVLIGGAGFFVFRACSRRAEPVGGTGDGATGVDATEVAEPEPEPTTINLMMVGDMLFHYQVRMSGLSEDGSRNYDHLFAHIGEELAGQDIKVINQETPIGGPVYVGSAPDGYDGYPEFNGPQEVGDAEAKAGDDFRPAQLPFAPDKLD